MADDNRPLKYIRYAIGEIILVVTGILIALSINNWNEGKKLRKVERAILEGIRENIMQDTVDINANMRSYQDLIKVDSIILYNLTHHKAKSDWIVNSLYGTCTADMILTLHTSYFDEAKQKGLSIITNQTLRKKISHLYNFDYPFLINIDNHYKPFNTFELLYPILGGFFEIDSSSIPLDKVIIDDKKYDLLLSDKNLHYKIFEAQTMRKLLLRDYNNRHPNIEEIISLIENELENFE